ncbi:hypothetical protein Huta_2927 [Halorhabdus utahensis DSM 12940]|uniref:Carotenoid biosynthesis protein n=1 Tax=Halorhabdus utahensis (strain DSM 12940 / JCM 11049 / AX-2) TaxID=519442 RepID=C7NRX4_HALUD|nr:carotenoid biosynthesis protein [Halorhabdus utahensis]ACV13088.1 hypothetical protein Huta_2927 [Halorhabdus utahensis DSM 12940]
MVEWAYPAFTLFGALIFGLALSHAWPDRRRTTMVVSGLAYGLLLEQLTILAYEAYSYPVGEYLVTLANVPLAIGLLWASVLYAGYVSARNGGLTGIAAALFVALFALHVDLAIDAVAIRVPYWEWGRWGEWFGVPLGNFVGWFWVAVAYGGWWWFVERQWPDLSRMATGAAVVGGIVVPTGGLMVTLAVYDVLVFPTAGLLAGTAGTVALAIAIVMRAGWQPHAPPTPIAAIPVVTHVFFLGVALWLGYGRGLIAIGLVMLMVSVLVHLPPKSLSGLREG